MRSFKYPYNEITATGISPVTDSGGCGYTVLCGSMVKRQNRRGVKKVEKPCEHEVSSINEPIFDDFQGETT